MHVHPKSGGGRGVLLCARGVQPRGSQIASFVSMFSLVRVARQVWLWVPHMLPP